VSNGLVSRNQRMDTRWVGTLSLKSDWRSYGNGYIKDCFGKVKTLGFTLPKAFCMSKVEVP
jgi:hypothetical protein